MANLRKLPDILFLSFSVLFSAKCSTIQISRATKKPQSHELLACDSLDTSGDQQAPFGAGGQAKRNISSSMNRVDSSGFDHCNFQTLVSVYVKIEFVLAVLFLLGRCHLTHLMPPCRRKQCESVLIHLDQHGR